MDNKRKSGKILNYANGTEETIAGGSVVVIGNRIGVVVGNILPGEIGAVEIANAFELPKKTSDTVEQGARLFWDVANGELTLTGTGNVPAGYAIADAEGDLVTVKLEPLAAQMPVQADSAAGDLAALIVDFNALLSKLKAAGYMANA